MQTTPHESKNSGQTILKVRTITTGSNVRICSEGSKKSLEAISKTWKHDLVWLFSFMSF
ncbi:MAG: hypothetical protein KKC03_06640 [Bacteroidetes bacterium]|nr:hypothetical protein [Bacteroidota bacterium]